MATKKIKETTFVSIKGIEYLTFPQALKYIGIVRGLLHQRIMRDAGKDESDENAINAINIEKYVFVPRSYCEKVKKEIENEASAEKLKNFGKAIQEQGWTLEQIESLLKKEQAAKKK